EIGRGELEPSGRHVHVRTADGPTQAIPEDLEIGDEAKATRCTGLKTCATQVDEHRLVLAGREAEARLDGPEAAVRVRYFERQAFRRRVRALRDRDVDR